MKNILLRFLILGSVFFVLTLISCSDNDDPFAGSDNYIVSLSLVKDGVTYKADIIENRLEIAVPNNINLNGASVDYKLSEQASITPNPSTIQDWDEEQRFTIKSHNNTSREYTYRVKHTDILEVGTVTLLTQADVDKFASSGVAVIDGNLIIGSNKNAAGIDSIKNLEGLLNVKTIGNNLTIYNSFGGKEFSGLRNLESVGNIYIKNLTTRKAIEDSLDIILPNLTTIGDFYASTSLLRTASFPKLEQTLSFYVNSPALSELSLPNLKTVITDFVLESGTNFNSANANTANKKLKEINLSSLKEIGGSFILRGLGALESLNISQLENIQSNWSIQAVEPLSSISATTLKSVKGAFALKYVDDLGELFFPEMLSLGSFSYEGSYSAKKLELLDLPKLEVVDGNFKIDYASLESLNLKALKKIGLQLNMRFCELLTSINMPALEECNDIYFYTLPLLSTLDLSSVKELDMLEVIACYKLALVKANNNINNITLNGGSRLCEFTQFEGLQTIPGALTVTLYTQNKDFNFPGLKHIGQYTHSDGLVGESVLNLPDLETVESLRITSASFLKKLNAPKLTTVSDTWNSSYMPNINSGDIYVPNLRKIGTFKFYGGTYAGIANLVKLTDLNDFASLEEVKNIDIRWWGKMTDFSGLKKVVAKIDAENWLIDGCAYNPTYEQAKNGKLVQP